MRSTGYLRTMGDFSLPRDVLVMHPNDGYDLGLLSTHNPLHIFMDCTLEDFQAGNGTAKTGNIHLKNDCPHSTLRINLAMWNTLGKPRHVKLVCRDHNLLIVPE